jgi:hypothetical protein
VIRSTVPSMTAPTSISAMRILAFWPGGPSWFASRRDWQAASLAGDRALRQWLAAGAWLGPTRNGATDADKVRSWSSPKLSDIGEWCGDSTSDPSPARS